MTRTITPLFVFLLLLCASASTAQSVAREWNEALLSAIRKDFARPTVHARNLFHSSVAMYDAWAVYDDEAETYFLGKTVDGFECAFTPLTVMPTDIEAAQEEAISYAAFRLLSHRFQNSPGAFLTLNNLNTLFTNLGYNAGFTSVDYSTGSPAALGNYIAQQLIAFGLQDGSNEQFNYANQYYEPVNDPMIVSFPGNPDISDYNRWQPLTLSVFVDQSGNVFPGNTPPFLGPEWGAVAPFALEPEDLTIYERDGNPYYVYHDPGPPPYLDTNTGGGLSAEYQYTFSLVAAWSSHMSPDDGVMWDISPGNIGNIAVEDYPTTIEGLRDFYDIVNGGDIGEGYAMNPVTGEPYAPQIVPRGDYARVLAEFWADGPSSETPPGHWFTILNTVNDDPNLVRQFGGQGEVLEPLEWNVKTYFTLGGAMHDAAITVWGIKGWYDYLRPVSAIRAMGDLGQSTDPDLPSYHPGGIPLIDGLIALVNEGDPLAGNMNQHVGKVKLKAWRGPDFITIPEIQDAGVGWILSENWWPYQRPTFVSPNFAGYISGHSTFSRSAAEIMTAITGDPFFPGGVGRFEAPQNEFLVFEDGPSIDLTLEWATYRDASDQCSLSRIWGGIHPPVDDIPGRLIGIDIGNAAFEHARALFYKDEDADGFYSYEDCDDNNNTVYPGAPEICDGLDNNCNDDIDEGVLLTFYLDTDEDTYGDAGQSIEGCTAPAGYVADNTDCNDTNADEFPGQTWYLDRDGDSYGDGSTVVSCGRPEFGYLPAELLALDTDCNDNNSEEFPGQIWYLDQDEDNYGDGTTVISCARPEFGNLSTELVAVDTDCDDNDAQAFPTQDWYIDADADGYGSGEVIMDSCERPSVDAYLASELTATSGDCDDTRNQVYPGAPEICDDLDNDCNNEIDEDLPLFVYYLDADNDGFGDLENPIEICGELPSGYVVNSEDCDDTNNSIYPNAPDIADNGIDEDCTGVDFFAEAKIFPNPFEDELTVHLNQTGIVNIRIFDLSGRLVYRGKETLLDNRFYLSLSNLHQGVFMLRLEAEDGKELLLRRIIKM